jgi:hypothetical protein
MKRQLLLAAPLLALGLALSGCADAGATPAVATAGDAGAPAASQSPEASDEDKARQFAECMRGEGVDMPDPEPGSGPGGGEKPRIAIRVEAGDKAKVGAAMEKCRRYLPNGGEMKPLTPEQLERQRELARCMRENGVPDFPDPDPNGGGGVIRNFADRGDKEAMEKALEKCRDIVGGDLTVKSGKA